MVDKSFDNKIIDARNDIEKLEQIEKECENGYNEVYRNLDDAQKTNPNQTDTINELKSLQVEKKFNLLYAGLIAEKCADQRDSVLAKQLLLDNKAGQIVILGLDNSGKTSLLRTLKDNPFDEYTSSLSLNYEELIMGNMKFTAFNLAHRHAQGGHLWKSYIPNADSIVFLIDAADPIRFAKAKAELDDLLKDEKIFNIPIVILGSKSDSENAVNEESLRAALVLSETMEQHNDGRNLRNLQLYMCNMNDIGTFGCAFRYIGRFLKET